METTNQLKNTFNEVIEELKPINQEVVKKEETVPEKKFSFPIDFEENVTPSRVTNKNVLKVEKEAPKKVSELYSKKEVVVEKTKFKPTPVISPLLLNSLSISKNPLSKTAESGSYSFESLFSAKSKIFFWAISITFSTSPPLL